MWLISHASGTFGRAVARAALDRGHPVRVLVRDAGRASSFDASAQVAVVDLANRTGIRAAFEGVAGAVLTAPLGPEFVQWHRALAEAAADAGVRNVVQLSGQSADINSPTRILRWLADAEAQAAAAGVHATVLRPALYMQMLFKHVNEICTCGVIEAPFRNARWGLVDARDVADVAVERLERAAKPSVRELTGPHALDYAEIAKVVTKVTGRKVTYVDVCSPKARGRLEAKRVPPRLADALLEYWDFHSAHPSQPHLTHEIETLLGRPPRKLADFIKDHKQEFAGAACNFAAFWGPR